MKVIIYKQTKTASQSGFFQSKDWIVEYPQDSMEFEPLMGWTKSNNTKKQIQLKFDNFEQALEYVKKNNLDYVVRPVRKKKFKIKSYSDNFKYNRNK